MSIMKRLWIWIKITLLNVLLCLGALLFIVMLIPILLYSIIIILLYITISSFSVMIDSELFDEFIKIKNQLKNKR